jgi:hypothetical protein
VIIRVYQGPTGGSPPALLEKVSEGKLGCLGSGINHGATFVVAALETCLMRQLLLMAIRAINQGKLVEMVMSASRAGTALRMTSLRIRHFSSS